MASCQRDDEPSLLVAIVGAGPAAFFAAEALLASGCEHCEIDMYERLPAPFGLVRYGVAPDHQRIKLITESFEETATHPCFRFFGNVEVGRDVTLEQLQRHYHAVLVATGAQGDRKMNIPGENLQRSITATEFVAWYNGHPDYVDQRYDLSQASIAVVGAGNVALDVARILCLSPQELWESDMAPHAVEELSKSRVRDVYVLARRGPAQAAFSNPELRELRKLENVDIVVHADEVVLDPLSADDVRTSGDRTLIRKVELLNEYATQSSRSKTRRLHLRFLVSPSEICDDGTGAVGHVVVERNHLVRTESGSLVPRSTGAVSSIPTGMVIGAVGYRGVALPGAPFDERWGVIHNSGGRATKPETGCVMEGLYTAGWIKRGPAGVIGTNKPDARETVNAILEDAPSLRDRRTLAPRQAIQNLLSKARRRPLSFLEWKRIDAAELAAGRDAGRPRIKVCTADEMMKDAHGREDHLGMLGRDTKHDVD